MRWKSAQILKNKIIEGNLDLISLLIFQFRSILSAISKLSYVSALSPKIREKMGEYIKDMTKAIEDYIEQRREADTDPESFAMLVTRLCDFTTYNVLSTNKSEGINLYNKIIEFFSNIVFPNHESLSHKLNLEVCNSVNTMYLWLSSFIISRQN